MEGRGEGGWGVQSSKCKVHLCGCHGGGSGGAVGVGGGGATGSTPSHEGSKLMLEGVYSSAEYVDLCVLYFAL